MAAEGNLRDCLSVDDPQYFDNSIGDLGTDWIGHEVLTIGKKKTG